MTKIHIVKALVFPGVMYGCESWTVKNAERQRIHVFELWGWRRLLTVPWTARISNQWILKEINPEHSLEGHAEAEMPVLWIPGAKDWLIGKVLDAGEDWRQGEKGMTEDEMVGQHHWLNGHEFKQALGVSDGQGSLACCSPWGHKVRHDWMTELNWRQSELTSCSSFQIILLLLLEKQYYSLL